MNIFVSNLNIATSSEMLWTLFEQFGTVASAVVITDSDTGISKGYGFVEMPNDEEAQTAIDILMVTEFDGKIIVGKKVEPGESRSGGLSNRDGKNRGNGGGNFGAGGGGRHQW